MIKRFLFFRSESNFMHALYIFFLTIKRLPVNEEEQYKTGDYVND